MPKIFFKNFIQKILGNEGPESCEENFYIIMILKGIYTQIKL